MITGASECLRYNYDPKRQARYEELLGANSSLAQSLRVRLTDYIPHQPTPKQRIFLMLPHREAFYGGAAGGGKLLRLDEPIPTPTGWTNMGSIQQGDTILDDCGHCCTVTEAWDVELAPESYRLTFDDGTQIEAGAEHRWLTFSPEELLQLTRQDDQWRAHRRSKRPSRAREARTGGGRGKHPRPDLSARNQRVAEENRSEGKLSIPRGNVRTTAQLAAHTGRPHAIPISQPLDLPKVNLPLDPYVLGVWLGDGTSKASAITMHEDDWAFVGAEFERAGWSWVATPSSSMRWSIPGLITELRKLGLYKNKHIPPLFLRGSIEQRLALLQGLMDTDGTSSSGGSAEFCTTNKVLARNIHELIISLGWKVRQRESRTYSPTDGRDIGPKWTLKWSPDQKVFRIPRKAEAQRLSTRRTVKFRYIKQVEPCPSSPMRCISVDSPSHLFLAGRSMLPTHNSDALLMGALQYTDVPGYSAIIFRKNLTDANLPGAIMARAREWLEGARGVYLRDNIWYFPSGATLTFGFLSDELKKFRYQGAEFQYIAFDELTQFYEEDYLYLRSRLRRPKCPYHGGRIIDGHKAPLPDDPNCPSCRQFAQLSRVPLKMRAAANPGGLGHLWVKKRFDIGLWIKGHNDQGQPIHQLGPMGQPLYIGRNSRRPFVPALLPDNPYLDQEEYAESLRELDPVTREQLLNGDWSVSANGRFRQSWKKLYSINPAGYVILGPNCRGVAIPIHKCRRFIIGDPAASVKEGPGDDVVYKGSPSWTVFGTFLLTPDNHLIIWDWVRFRDEVSEQIATMKRLYRRHRPEFIGLERSPLSEHLYQLCCRIGLPMKPLYPRSRDKLQRATDVINRMEMGRVWFPQDPRPWLEDLEAELFTWTAHPYEPDDQVDVLAYAGLHVSRLAAYVWDDDHVLGNDPNFLQDSMPDVY